MKTFVFIILVSFSLPLNAQTKSDSLSHNTEIKLNLINAYQGNQDFSSFRINPETMFFKTNSQDIIPGSMIWTETRMSISEGSLPYGIGENVKPDLLQPYYNFYVESKNISLFRKVLGIAQLSAVGYLAYKHIKKYGLFHQP